MSDSEDSKSWHRYRDAVSASTKLMREDGNEALRLLDDAIATAVSEGESQLVLTTLSHHAATISRFLGNSSQVKHYYQQSLSFNPENPRALFGLANVAKEQGELELAKQYAARCYKTLVAGDERLKKEWFEMLLKKWPEVAEY